MKQSLTKVLFTLGLLAAPGRCVDGSEQEHGEEEHMADVDHAEHMADLDHALTHEQIHSLVGKLDTNKDGKVSMEEIESFAAVMRQRMAKQEAEDAMRDMDSNQDKQLTLEEVTKHMLPEAHMNESDKADLLLYREVEEAKFKAADKDGDGRLSLAELPAFMQPELSDKVLSVATEATLKHMDADGDGEVSMDEFLGATPEEVSKEELEQFKGLDKDGSGKLNAQEFRAWESGFYHNHLAMQKLFEISDKDHDMKLSQEELEAASEAIKESEVHYQLMEWASSESEL